MSFRLPPAGSAAQEAAGDMASLAEILDPKNASKLPDFSKAIRQSKATMAKEGPIIKSINTVCIRGDDERWLIRVGPRGGWKRLWNFGTGRD